VFNKKSKEASWKHWLNVVRSHDRTKTAEIGGRGDDVAFEQAFSNLAHAYLRDSAPKLMDHEIGFQLLDRNRENTKAVGVFAFKVGSMWLYAPVFFLNGDLKGHELLYIKNQDMFVPLKENWVNYLINRKPSILGAGIDKNLTQFGQRQPDFTQLSRSPAKFGSARPTMYEKNAYEVGGQTLDHSGENLELYSGSNKYKYGPKTLPWFAHGLEPDLLKNIQYAGDENEGYTADLRVPLSQAQKHKILQQYIAGARKEQEQTRKMLAAHAAQQKKIAAADPTLKEMMTAVMPALAKTATMNTKLAFEELGHKLNLREFLKQAGLQTIAKLVQTCQYAPQMAKAIDEFHGLDIIKEAIATATARQNQVKIASVLSEAPETPKAESTLKVVTYDATVQTALPPGYTEEDQEKLLRDGVLITDKRDRDNVSVPYQIQVEQKLFNPTQSGLYMVLVKPGEIEKCYIAVYPQGPAKRSDFVTVVRTEGKPEWINTRADHVFCFARVEGDEFDSWFNGLSDANSVSKSGRYMAISKSGDSTVPFRVIREYGETEFAGNAYEVHMEDHSKFPPKGSISPCCYTDPLNYDKYRDGVRVHLNAKGGRSIRSSMGDIFIPEGFKLLKCAPGEDDGELDGQSTCGCGESDNPPLMPGNLADAQLVMMQKLSSLTVYHNGTAVEIHSPKKQSIEKELSEKEALVSLVARHGLREKNAREILSRARAKRKFACHVKYANPYGSPMMIQNAPTAPADPGPVMGGESIMGTSVPTQLGIDVGVPVPGMSASQTDRSVYNPNTELDQGAVQQVMQAAQSGQREVFDTAMIGTMLRAVRDDGLVDRYMGELTKGLDKLGRILFMFYWHGDRFADRYGKADMPELEDSLRNAFEMLGDVILFLKQKTIEPYPEESSGDVDLGPSANV
jgi:hypothetical protein